MKITFGDQVIEVRPWGGEDSGKVLLMTDSKEMKKAILNQLGECPEAFELLDDGGLCGEDVEDVFLIVAHRDKVGIFFDLEKMRPGVCVCQEEEYVEIEDE